MKDIEIISLVLSGNIESYEKIMRRYNGYLYKVGKSYGFNHNDVEDLMQETYIDVFINLKNFENRASFKTWIVRIMLNNCFHKKQKYKQHGIPLSGEITENSKSFLENQSEETKDRVQNDELKEILEAAIHRIPESYRLVFTLRELNGMSVRETSQALKITEGNVKTRLSRSKSMLKEEIKKTYSPEEIFEFDLIYCDKLVAKGMKTLRTKDISS
ncbi:sigma-70 family RNA polymerase sigma factor [Aequorivita sp. H23M31]|uniref:Sigma-70 family RNA polymerase sigma factor n=1 Tax=Aequorivita ciconiae TaxID=2494375 RepID=A0A410G3Z2_9FLAO|nr:sigma-70 family RNA polymerase sigma factor [Aequorivita sp. H23M31]QAA81990.1 sigma-70 family RNA polymerase sigma factor [Aequorivita sp. H23M31]